MMEHVPHIENIAVNGWTGVVMLFIILGYLLSLGMSWRKYVKRVSSLGKQRMRMVSYEDEVTDWRVDFLLTVSVLMSMAMCVFSLITGSGSVEFSVVVFLIVLGLIVVFLLLKLYVARLLGMIFQFSIYVAEMKMRVVLFFSGILCLFFSMIAAHYDAGMTSLILFGIMVVAYLVAEFIILVENFFGKKGALFYIFLYLCAAEILPLAVGFRIATQVLN